jgi:hypothetical protein
MAKYKILGYAPLYYGKEYLRESLQSVVNHVDEFVVLYTENPSYGHGTTLKCPDSEAELRAIAEEVLGPKLIWVKGQWGQEGAHRGEIYRYSGGYDGILAIDADEVYCQETLPIAIDMAMKQDRHYVGFGGYINFWRSFNNACYDGFTPVRFMNLHRDRSGSTAVVPCTVYHFSCAQSREIMDFKYEIHGHKDEIRPNWLNGIYYGDQIQDVHPTSYGLWNAVPFDKNTLPESLKAHPNFNKDRI